MRRIDKVKAENPILNNDAITVHHFAKEKDTGKVTLCHCLAHCIYCEFGDPASCVQKQEEFMNEEVGE